MPGQKKLAVHTLSSRSIICAASNWKVTRLQPGEKLGRAQEQVRRSPDDPHRWVVLAELLVARARHDQDPRGYARADDAAVRALELSPGLPGAVVLQGTVLLQDHRFAEGAELARRALRRDPENTRALGLLGDCLVELGRYDEAEVAIQAMIDLRPDSRSYARAARMRWLAGDAEGSVEAFAMAAEAAQGGDAEARAWIAVQLGTVLRDSGDTAQARAAYDAALRVQPGYAPALGARGKLLLDGGDAAAAVTDLEAAVAKTGLVEHRWPLVDALRATGKAARADQIAAEISRAGPAHDPRTTALWLASRGGDANRAGELDRAELARRDDVLSADALSWALYAAGRLDEARAQRARALRMGTKDPRMLYHAGMIAKAAGDRDHARALLSASLAANARFDAVDAPLAAEALASL
jgi:tetratricopeptide (TPR) repeat protein